MGCYGSQLEAAQALARVLGVPVEKLKKKNKFTRKHARKLFKAAYRVFKKYFPGDLEKTGLDEKAFRALFRKDWWVIEFNNFVPPKAFPAHQTNIASLL